MSSGIEDIAVRISTCKRSPTYVHQTLATLLSDPQAHRSHGIRLVVDGTDDSYLRDYKHLSHLVGIDTHSAREQAQRRGKGPHFGCAYNFYRALRSSRGAEAGVVVFEDDVILRGDWTGLLVDAVNELHAAGGRRYILSLNTRGKTFATIPSFRRGRWYASFGGPFYGTQGIFVPATYLDLLLAELEGYLARHGQRGWQPLDLWLGEAGQALWRDRGSCPTTGIYATAADLCEHIGEISTGLGGGDYYGSQSFTWDRATILAHTGG